MLINHERHERHENILKIIMNGIVRELPKLWGVVG